MNSGALYLRRWRSSRLTVLDVELLCEVGEVMLPALLSAAAADAVLFSDGGQFFHLSFDPSHWNLVCTALDEQFTPVEQSPTTQPPTASPSLGIFIIYSKIFVNNFIF